MTTSNDKNGKNGKLTRTEQSSSVSSVSPQPAATTVQPSLASQPKTQATSISQSQLLYVTESGAIRRDHRCDVSKQVDLAELCQMLGVHVEPLIAPTLAQYGKQSLQLWLAYFRDNVINVQSVIQAHVTQAVAAGMAPVINEMSKKMQANMFQYPLTLLASHESIHGEPIFLPTAPGEYVAPSVTEAPLTLNATAHSA